MDLLSVQSTWSADQCAASIYCTHCMTVQSDSVSECVYMHGYFVSDGAV